MKKYLLILSILFLSAAGLIQAQTNQKLGYVDSQVILTQWAEAIKAQGDLDALTNKWSAQLDSMTQAYQQAANDYQKQVNTMPEDKKLSSQQRLVQMENDIMSFRKDKFAQGTGEIYKKNDEIFAPIKAKIYDAIGKVAKEENMNFIFDKSGDIILLYADSAFDVTYKVLDKLKRGS
ncbi:MAG TPA: OmpH family outer membrane protein [Ignavibacteriaceae bacterium]|nr:OmpH family outer membrane protein [Ignavibacteriaceae bacterium]